ncbi:MAG: DUF6384 family protein [Hyphomonadaceae bacterium]|nr:DUF6384 family protein [Hyphomonadaceae bacterium]
MTETESPTAKPQSLDEVLVAMDVVDTLRHRDQIFLKQIDHEGREEDLVARLKEIYTAQGMDVPEETIRDGVRAMADKRFTHEPAKKGFLRRLAIIYITRARWWKPAAAASAAVLALGGAYQFGVAMPKAAAERALVRDLTETIPANLAEARDAAMAVAETDTGRNRALALYQQGMAALEAEDRAAGEAAVDALTGLRHEISAQYQVRVVNDPDDFTGIYREHDDLPGRQNYYLIVEAVSPTGDILEVTVRDEETNAEVRVKRWGQRVSRTVFEGVAADKQDDMIIQDAIIGTKQPGAFEPAYSVSTPGGAITEW